MLKRMMFLTVTMILILIFCLIAFAKSAEKINAVVFYGDKCEELSFYNVEGKKCINLEDAAIILKNSEVRFDCKFDDKKNIVVIENGKSFKEDNLLVINEETPGYDTENMFFDTGKKVFEFDVYEIKDKYFIRLENLAEIIGFKISNENGSDIILNKNIQTKSDILKSDETLDSIISIFDTNKIGYVREKIKAKFIEIYGKDAYTNAVHKKLNSNEICHDFEFLENDIKLKIFTKEVNIPYNEISQYLKYNIRSYAVISEFSADKENKNFIIDALKIKRAIEMSENLSAETTESEFLTEKTTVETSAITETNTKMETSNDNEEVTEKENELVVALTFDDGPKRKTTERILNVLEKYNAKATFFVVGNMAEGNGDILKRAYDLGCQIGNHSYSHKILTKLPIEEAKQEINKTSNIVYNATGDYARVGRPPYGSLNHEVKEMSKIEWFNWSIDTYDWKKRDADSVYENIMKNIGNYDVILMHDLYTSTAEAVERVVPELAEKGYRFVTISELVKIKGGADKVSGHIKK